MQAQVYISSHGQAYTSSMVHEGTVYKRINSPKVLHTQEDPHDLRDHSEAD